MIRGSGSFSLLAWIVSFTTLTTLAVVLRFWSARIQRRKFYLDDGLVIASYVSSEPLDFNAHSKNVLRVFHRSECLFSKVLASGP